MSIRKEGLLISCFNPTSIYALPALSSFHASRTITRHQCLFNCKHKVNERCRIQVFLEKHNRFPCPLYPVVQSHHHKSLHWIVIYIMFPTSFGDESEAELYYGSSEDVSVTSSALLGLSTIWEESESETSDSEHTQPFDHGARVHPLTSDDEVTFESMSINFESSSSLSDPLHHNGNKQRLSLGAFQDDSLQNATDSRSDLAIILEEHLIDSPMKSPAQVKKYDPLIRKLNFTMNKRQFAHSAEDAKMFDLFSSPALTNDSHQQEETMKCQLDGQQRGTSCKASRDSLSQLMKYVELQHRKKKTKKIDLKSRMKTSNNYEDSNLRESKRARIRAKMKNVEDRISKVHVLLFSSGEDVATYEASSMSLFVDQHEQASSSRNTNKVPKCNFSPSHNLARRRLKSALSRQKLQVASSQLLQCH